MLSSSSAAGTITINAPAGAGVCSARFSSQRVWPGTLTARTPPGGGYPNVWQRVDASNLDVWRVQMVEGYNDDTTDKASPAAYTGSDGHSVTAWNFADLDKELSTGPTNAVRELGMVSPPDALWTGTGPLGGGGTGALADQSYGQLASWAANLAKYFRTGILVTNSGATVTYTATSLTDTAKDFTTYGGGGYAVTATVIDNNGFPDWEIATITSVTNSGHTLNFSAWSTANSAPNNGDGGLRGTAPKTPAAGAAYNLASVTPPVTSPANAHPWPRPPSVGDIAYFELFNEPDLSHYNYARTAPSLPPPTPTLTGVNVSGGTLTPGSTYSYRITAANLRGSESLPGTEVSITLPAGTNAIKIDWSSTSNMSLTPSAYRIYGRTTGGEHAMVVVGRDASTGLTWTDKGSVTPSGNLPTTDNTAGAQVWAAHEYTKMWNVVAPAIKAIDPSIKLVGPTISNPISLATNDVDPTVVTTGPNDNSWKSTADYIPVLMAGANPKPDAVSLHNYGWFNGSTSTEAQQWSGLNQGISDFLSEDYGPIGNTPVLLDETNIDAGFFGNAPSATNLTAETQMGAAWLADSYVQWCARAPNLSSIQMFQEQDFNGDVSWGLFSSASYAGSTTCFPQPNCANIRANQPNLEYWLVKTMNANFPVGSKVVPVSGVPSGWAAFAVQPVGSTKISFVVVNTQINGSAKGAGVADSVTVQLAGANSSATTQTIIDGNTSPTDGPTTSSLGAQNAVTLNMTGYGVGILTFDAAGGGGGDTTPPLISNVTSNGVTSSSANINWTTDESSDSQVDYGTTSSYGSSTLLNTNLVTTHSVNLTGLSASTTYHYRVKSKDASGNLTTGSDNTFTTTAGTGGGNGMHVVGNLLKNGSGSTVTLRGVNRAGSEYACIQGWGIFDGPNVTNDDAQVTLMKSWGINSINIGINEDCWLGINGVPAAYGGTNYINAIKHEVATAEANNMIPIISYFWSAPGTTQATDQAAMPDNDHAPATWQSIANTFKADPNVIFRLKEEPYPAGDTDGASAWGCWKNGDVQYDTSNTLTPVSTNTNCSEGYPTVGFQSLINIVRGTGATNVIQVPGTQYANSMTNFLNATYKVSDTLNPAQLMGVVDVYPHDNVCGSVTCYNSKYAPVIATIPFAAGEIGEDINGTISTMTDVDTLMNWLDGQGAGYLAWTWDTWGGTLQLITDYTTGNPKSPWGVDYKNHLAAVGNGGGLGSGGAGIQGDLNGDGHVTILDLSIMLSHYGTSGSASQGDCNNDGTINIVDLSILLSHYGT